MIILSLLLFNLIASSTECTIYDMAGNTLLVERPEEVTEETVETIGTHAPTHWIKLVTVGIDSTTVTRVPSGPGLYIRVLDFSHFTHDNVWDWRLYDRIVNGHPIDFDFELMKNLSDAYVGNRLPRENPTVETLRFLLRKNMLNPSCYTLIEMIRVHWIDHAIICIRYSKMKLYEDDPDYPGLLNWLLCEAARYDVQNNSGLTRILLQHGANPNPDVGFYGGRLNLLKSILRFRGSSWWWPNARYVGAMEQSRLDLIDTVMEFGGRADLSFPELFTSSDYFCTKVWGIWLREKQNSFRALMHWVLRNW